MSKGLRHKPTKLSDDDIQVEFIGLIDGTSDADVNEERIRFKIASMIALGLKKGRPRKENDDNEKIAA